MKRELVKNHLLREKKITSWQAFILYGVTRLANDIFVLRKHGWKIQSDDKKEGKSNFTEYKLLAPPIPPPSPLR